MQITKVPIDSPLPCERAFVLSMVIRSFKGRRDVEVHLFRSGWAETDALICRGEGIFEPAASADKESHERACAFLMEAFTAEERDALIDYLSARYADKVSEITAAPLPFPIPTDISPLSTVPLGQDIGLIHLWKIPNYPLPFKVDGLFDLAVHKPMVQG